MRSETKSALGFVFCGGVELAILDGFDNGAFGGGFEEKLLDAF